MDARIRITTSIRDEVAAKFAELTRQIGVSGTALLSRTLPAELDYLAEIPSNTERAQNAYRLGEKLRLPDTESCIMRRLNITLDRQDAERMNRLCAAKGVPRDAFIRCYVDFLVNGDGDVCEGPLAKVGEILANPRHEYEQKQKKRPSKPRENPYSSLHLGEDVINLMATFMKERTGEKL